jgi:hypothetical protein
MTYDDLDLEQDSSNANDDFPYLERKEQTMSNEVLDEERRRFIGASLVAVFGAAVASTGLLASGEASAQTGSAGPVKQPAVIGYPNEKGVQIERVTYPARNMGTTIVANVFKRLGSTGARSTRRLS